MDGIKIKKEPKMPKDYSVVIECCRKWLWGQFADRNEADQNGRSIIRHHTALLKHKCYGAHIPVVTINGKQIKGA